MINNKRPFLIADSMQYTGSFTSEKTVLEIIKYDSEKNERATIETFGEAKDEAQKVWLNIIGLNDIELIEEIGRKYSINRLVLEDIVHIENYPKIEVYDTYIFAVLKMVYLKN